MKILFTDTAWEDYLFWEKTDKAIIKRINLLLEDMHKHSSTGLGKPEALKFNLAGCWSRRINLEHRLVYTLKDGDIIILQCRYHYFSASPRQSSA